MTDYLDKELDPKRSEEIERHLKTCPACREFLETVRAAAVTPFENAEALKPDAGVWQKIEEKVRAIEEKPAGWTEKLAEALAPIFRMPKPVYRVAFVLGLAMIAVLVMRFPSVSSVDPAYAYIEEQMTFLGQLESGDTDLLNGDLNGYADMFEEISN